MYPIMIPAKIGIRRRSPFPKRDTTTVVRSAMMASAQLVLAIFTPVPANESPMSMITGPTTTGGKSLEMNPTPRSRISRLIMQYTSPTPIIPNNAPGRPYSSVALMIGAMKAKLLPKKIGTFPFVTA